MRISDWSSDVCSSDLGHVSEGHRHDDIHLAANQGRDACRPLCNGLEQYLGNIAGYALVPVALVTFERSLDLGLTLDDLDGAGAIFMQATMGLAHVFRLFFLVPTLATDGQQRPLARHDRVVAWGGHCAGGSGSAVCRE